MKNQSQIPSFTEEEILIGKGYRNIAGVDEVGRGPLAGPVVAAAVVLPNDIETHWLGRVRDSKQLPKTMREILFKHIQEDAAGIGVGCVESPLIDEAGIVAATRMAMKLAIEQLRPLPDYVLIDHITVPEVRLPQKGITKGDTISLSIACASIIAKVARDYMMEEYEGMYPGYGFGRNKGYGTPEHLACLRNLGPCPIHRRSFQPVRGMTGV